MADKKISQLTATTTVDLADKYALARGAGNFYLTYETLQNNLATPTGSFVKTVNGVAGDAAGNVAVSLASVETGLSSSFPALPSDGDVYVISGETATDRTGSNGQSFIYSSGSSDWFRLSGLDEAGNDARYVNVSGDTMTGALTLPADPTVALQAATKQYVDGKTAVGTNGQTLRFNGTTLEANSLLFNNGSEIGIGTTSPTAGIPLSVDSGASNISMELQGRVANPPSLQFNATDAAFGGVLWMSGTDGHFNFGARGGFPDSSRRVSGADPVDAQNFATKNYADNIIYTVPVIFSGTGTGTNGNVTAGTKLQFTADVDSDSGWSTDTYTIPEDGVYEIVTSLRTQIETTDRRSAIYKGSSFIRIIENPKGATDGGYRSRTGVGHIIASYVTGDEISVRSFQTTTNYPNVAENGLSIRKIRN